MPLTINLKDEAGFKSGLRAIRNAKMRAERPVTTLGALAKKYGMTYQNANGICQGITGPRAGQNGNWIDNTRTTDMIAKYEAGRTLQSIGEEYGVSRERVRQLLAPSAITKKKKFVAVLQHAEAEKLKQEIQTQYKQELNEKLQKGMATVKTGASIAEAARTVGLLPNVLRLACKTAKVKSLHGRWRDNAAIKIRVRELRGLGLTWAQVIKQFNGEGTAHISKHWICNHTADLIKGHKPNSQS
jgi:hypothetical protein